MTSIGLRSLTSILLAVAGPAILLGFALHSLGRPPEWTPSRNVQKLDRELQRTQPELAVIGSSLALADIHTASLAKALDLPANRIAQLGQGGARGASWYAILKYRILENDYHPKVILLVGTMYNAWTTQVRSDRYSELAEHFPEPDSVLQNKAFSQTQSLLFRRLLVQRTRPRDALLDLARGSLVGWFNNTDPGISGIERAERAGYKVFYKEQTSGMEVATRVIPVVEERTPIDANDDRIGESIDDTFLPDMIELARSAGIKVAIVLPPLLPGWSDLRLDSTRERQTIDWVRRNELAWVDLRDQPYSSSDYTDGRHLTSQTAVGFSELLGQKLIESGVMGSGPISRPCSPPRIARSGVLDISLPTMRKRVQQTGTCAVRLLVPELAHLSRESLSLVQPGTAPPFQVLVGDQPLGPATSKSALDEGCSGLYLQKKGSLYISLPEPEAAQPTLRWDPATPIEDRYGRSWWLQPGGAITWSWDEPWTIPDSAKTLEVSLVSLGSGELHPTLRAGGQELEIPVDDSSPSPAPDPPTRAFKGSLELPPSLEPFEIKLRLPEGADPTLLLSLTVESGAQKESIVASRPSNVISLFKGKVSFDNAPPPAEDAELHVAGKVGYFIVKGGSEIGCSPYVVLEDNQPLRSRPPVFFVKTPKIRFVPSDLRATEIDPSRYRLAYRPERDCETRRWLLPGDTMRVSHTPGLLGPARTLSIQGRVEGAPTTEGEISLEIQFGEEFRVQETLTLSSLLEGRSWAVPLLPRTRPARSWVAVIQGEKELPPVLLDLNVAD